MRPEGPWGDGRAFRVSPLSEHSGSRPSSQPRHLAHGLCTGAAENAFRGCIPDVQPQEAAGR